jgi:ribonucleotide reductase beta subunit family protein with ferritin-like domain
MLQDEEWKNLTDTEKHQIGKALAERAFTDSNVSEQLEDFHSTENRDSKYF